MTSRYRLPMNHQASLCQGSCAVIPRAEKGRALDRSVQPPNHVQPLFLEVGRRKGAWGLAPPTSQPFFENLRRCACAYAYTRGFPLNIFFAFNQNKVREVRRLAKPMPERLFAVQPLVQPFFIFGG
jgi:hypothetical protein